MILGLTLEELAALNQQTRAEILAAVAERLTIPIPPSPPHPAPTLSEHYVGVDLVDREDVTFKHVRRLMEGLSAPVRHGLRLISEQGPVLHTRTLLAAEINLRFFQSATTRRIRVLTDDKQAFLLGWDNWNEVGEGEGRFAVTPITHQSLQRYFGLI